MPHPRNAGWQAGNHWAECQRCGFEYRQKELKKEWTNLIVCPDCYEPRHPQDFVRAAPDKVAAEGLVTSQGPSTNVARGNGLRFISIKNSMYLGLL